jgi:hypothetical protein
MAHSHQEIFRFNELRSRYEASYDAAKSLVDHLK